MPANAKMVAIDAARGKLPITIADTEQSNTNVNAKLCALVSSNLACLISCIDYSPGVGVVWGSGTIN